MAEASYDFVIIGGGVAGLVVATRLSEDPSQRVIVLEAGQDHSSDTRVKTPGFYPVLLGSELDWGFQSEAQPNLNGRSILLHQGKALGGSSAINAHVFVPPTKDLIDAWGALGNDGWNWDTFKKYFAKAYTSPSVASAAELGVSGWASKNDLAQGPLKASFSGNSSHPVRKAWIDSFSQLGHVAEHDPFLGASTGAFTCLSSIDPATRERSYAASAYYQPVKDRENLKILTGAVAEKILFDRSDANAKAKGVRYTLNGTTHEVLSTKEVIIAAGALQSPKLLEISGIGNANLLQSHGIELVKDLPAVGENLQDHPLCSISFEAVDEVDTLDALVRQEPEAIGPAMQEYATTQTGLLSSVGVYSYAYLPILDPQGKDLVKQMLLQNQPPPGNQPEMARAQAYYEVAEQALLDSGTASAAYLAILAQHNVAPPVPGKHISIGLMLSQALSRGSVHIRSKDIGAAPVIDPNYLSNPLDLEVMAQHMRYIETIASTGAFSDLLKKPLKHLDPDSRLVDVESAKKYLQSHVISMWHLGGTCAMLPQEKGGVVDSKLKVYGIDKLRVVDSSAVPLISTANLQATVYAFAERAADLIKQEYGLN
ncbi:hypothetical protein JX265_013152 [Neoarthrinium moseri]|uniref:Glucose-methanol-choline oxidoreductase N-terminal domain-containing protein n=1 Tax=Neoarthrinium moseri TaxID=1658444 RepID=A0A9Q0AHY9_9PEZI|nr:hypothetical protein JX266_012582 [Neoarthrinium moseri]KAI1851795.1 hypothetical protein JX265_013152 [Neoarthrinium moseri]